MRKFPLGRRGYSVFDYLFHMAGDSVKKKSILDEAYQVKVNAEQLAKARELVNLPEAIRHLIETINKTKVCPCCGTELKK